MATLSIKDGREKFYTYDTNRILIISDDDDETIDHVDFETDGDTSLYVDVEVDSDGTRYVTVPNELLNGDYSRITAFYMVVDDDGQYTLKKQLFRITYRQEITGYELEYTDVITLAKIKEITEAYRNEARKWANGTYVDGSDVASTDPSYHNNSKYYSEQSKGYMDTTKQYMDTAEQTIDTKETEALTAISTSKKDAVDTITTEKTNAVEAVEDEKDASLEELEDRFGFSVVDNVLCHTADGAVANPLKDAVAQEATMVDIADSLEKQNEYFQKFLDRGSIIDEKEIFMADVTEHCTEEKQAVTNTANSAINTISSTRDTAVSEVTSTKDSAESQIDSKVTSAENAIDSKVTTAKSEIDTKVSNAETTINTDISDSEERIAQTESKSITNIMNNFGLSLDSDGNLCSEAETEEGGTTGKDAIVLNATMVRLAIAMEAQNVLLQKLIDKQ